MYRRRLQTDLARWQAQGLILPATAAAMLADVERRAGRGWPLSRVLAILAAVLFGAAVVLLVAANWEAIPRPSRLALILLLIWLSYGGAALARTRGRDGLGEALLVFANLVFGAGIALVGQMYHLSGDSADAALVWFAGCFGAAILFRSPALIHAAVLLAWLASGALMIEADAATLDRSVFAPPVLAALLLAGGVACRAQRVGHGVALLVIAWAVRLYALAEGLPAAIGLAVLGLAVFLVALRLPAQGSKAETSQRGYAFATRGGHDDDDDGHDAIGPWIAFYGLATAFIGLAFVHAELDDAGWAALAIAGAATLAVAIGALSLAAAHSVAIRRLALAAFAVEVLHLAYRTVGTMLGTSGFFLAGGLLVALLAFLVTRLERRFRPAKGSVGLDGRREEERSRS